MRQNRSLFPWLLVRTAGAQYPDLKKLEFSFLDIFFKKKENITEACEKIKKQISDQLYSRIAREKDSKARNNLIRLRRDIYNGRAIDLETKANHLPSKITALINDYIHFSNLLRLTEIEGEKQYETELKTIKKSFVSFLQNKNFQEGILLASSTLPKNLKEYISGKNKNFSKLEPRLVKYLVRMYMKPSPFSTFTQIGVGKFADKNSILSQRKIFPKQTNQVQLNRILYLYLFSLLVQNKKLRKYFTITANFTIRASGKKYVYFIIDRNNTESFQHIAITPTLFFLYELIRSKRKWLYDDLVSEVIKRQANSVSQKDIEVYLDKLISLGFLECELEISGADPEWDKKLIQRLLPMAKEFSYINDVITMLKKIRLLSKEYEKASTRRKEKKLDQIYTLVRDTCFMLHGKAGLPKREHKTFQDNSHLSISHLYPRLSKTFIYKYKRTIFPFKKNTIFYEDSFLNGTIPIPVVLNDKLTILGDFLGRSETFDICTEKRLQLAHFFIEKYGEKKKIDLLQFYEDFSTDRKNVYLKTALSKNLLYKTHKKKNAEYLKIFRNRMKDQITGDDRVNISKKDVSHFPKQHTPNFFTSSFGALIQFYQNTTSDKDLFFVIDTVTSGFGQMFGRFLTGLPSAVQKDLLAYNKKLQKNKVLAETTDASCNNVCSHPSLTTHELRIPGGNQLPGKNTLISITDITVAYNPARHQLLLVDKNTNKEIYVGKLSLLTLQSRSELYAFLTRFNPDHPNIGPFLIEINNMQPKKGEITVLPRITYENTFLLQRKKWIIPKKFQPIRDPQESDWSYLQKIQTWRKNLRIPEEIFLVTGKEKPQYISFKNPLLVSVFEKCIKNMTREIAIQESIPNTRQQMDLPLGKYTSEIFAQWYQ